MTVDATTLVQRLSTVTGRPAATMFVAKTTERRFVLELTLSAVALYLAGKYLDGFVEGLGINALGKRHGRKVAKAISVSGSMIREAIDEDAASWKAASRDPRARRLCPSRRECTSISTAAPTRGSRSTARSS